MIQTVFFSTMVKDNIAANLIAACPDGIIGVDLRGAVVIFNAKAAALTQRNPEDVIGSLEYGGDEFSILLPETNLDQAIIVAEKICLMFNDSWPFDTIRTAALSRVTLSMGVVQRKDETSGEALMKRADVAMYNAKNQGGNRIVVG
jgi:diguanylate cyclase (GGDEF)-like protein